MALPFFYQALEIRLSMMVFIVASAWAASLLFVSLISYAIDRSKKFNAALLLCQALHCAAAALFFFCPSDYSKSQTLVWFICTYLAVTITGLLRYAPRRFNAPCLQLQCALRNWLRHDRRSPLA